MERRLRLLVVVVVQAAGVVAWAVGVLAVLGGPGWDASPMRTPRVWSWCSWMAGDVAV